MSHPSLHPRVLKVGWEEAAKAEQSLQLIAQLRENWNLAVIISAPNTSDFRTTKMLIESAEFFASWDIIGAKERLIKIRDFVLREVCASIQWQPNYPTVEAEIYELFERYILAIDKHYQIQKQGWSVYIDMPSFINDYTSLIYTLNERMRGSRTVLSRIPFLALWEDISGILYAWMTGGSRILSSSNIGWDIQAISKNIAAHAWLTIISGSFRMNPDRLLLSWIWFGYSDGNAWQLAAQFGNFFLHKTEPIHTANFRAIDWARPLSEIPLSSILSGFHPLVWFQPVNGNAFDRGVPTGIEIGNFSSGRTTKVVRGSRQDLPPLIQVWERVSTTERPSRHKIEWHNVSLNPTGKHRVLAIIDHFPNARSRWEQLRKLLWADFLIGALDERTTAVLVPEERADDVSRYVHAQICET